MHRCLFCYKPKAISYWLLAKAFSLWPRSKRANTLELEVVLSIVVRNVLNHARDVLHVVWDKTLLKVCTEEVTEETTEVLVTWVREE